MSAKSIRWVVVILAIAAAIYGLMPTFLDLGDGKLDGELVAEGPAVEFVMEHGQPLNLGLDLQGGLLLQYHVLVDKAVQDKLDRLADDLETRLKEKEEGLDVEVTHEYGESHIVIQFADAAKAELLDEDLLSFYNSLKKVDTGGGEVHMVMDEEYIDETKDYAIQQAIETIRQRVDALGVSEPSITRRGKSDIVVQLPGLKEDDVDRAKKLIGQTAQLEFRMVDDSGTNAFFNKFSGKLPEGFQLRIIDGGYRSVTHTDKQQLKKFFKGRVDDEHIIGYQFHPIYEDKVNEIIDEEKSYWKSYYVFKKVELTGDYIQEAQVAIDQRFNRPYVALNFDSKGAELFGELSANNVGKRMAIMLDDTVQSAPVFNEAIPGGRAQINMGSLQSYSQVLKDAENLVIVLRHGALPAPIEKQFETVVGPTLGQDSIDKSTEALAVGLLLVVVFMLIYYRASGAVSVLALLLNMLFIMSVLSSLGATLTLPGIAGIILTIGMAVDANVIIFERIREEVLAGRSPREAAAQGFDKALSAVMDANVTTGIAGLVLLQYGTGPIKGFAVTLLIGIVSTIFTAVFISRLLFDSWLVRGKKKSLSI
jgi:preprotein translocase subunit SecD